MAVDCALGTSDHRGELSCRGVLETLQEQLIVIFRPYLSGSSGVGAAVLDTDGRLVSG